MMGEKGQAEAENNFWKQRQPWLSQEFTNETDKFDEDELW